VTINIKLLLGKNKLIILLVLVSIFILGYPLIFFGIDRSFFYNIDPDVVYVTNAILYAKYAIINYIDHPGTPTIILIHYLFIPLRLLAKYIFHQGFIQWSFDNFVILFYYVRIFLLFLSGVSLWIFLKLIKEVSKSQLITVLVFLLTFSFSSLTFAIVIAPEILSFFLTVIWLAIFSKFTKTNKYRFNAILTFISGLAFANKFTSAFLVIISIFLPLFIRKLKINQKLTMIEANIAIALQSFIFGIWPVMNHFQGIIDWGTSLFSHTGMHGTGATTAFGLSAYLISATTLVKLNPYLVVFVLATLILGVVLVIRKKIKPLDPLIFLMSVSVIGIVVFAKYPMIHYSYVNILIITYCAAYFLSKIKTIWIRILLPILLLLFISSADGYISSASNKLQIKPTDSVYQILEKWTPFWAADVYREQLDANKNAKP
jgi:hypothetical protein